MNKNQYTQECMLLLNKNKWKLNNDPTTTAEGKIQKMLRKLDPSYLSEREYKVIYSSESSPEKFYGAAKIH